MVLPWEEATMVHPVVKTIEEGRTKRHTHTQEGRQLLLQHMKGLQGSLLKALFLNKYSNLYLIALTRSTLLVPMV